MNKKLIFFRTITYPKTGFGNLSRSLILANGLKNKGYLIKFLINQNALAVKEIKKRKFNYIFIPKFSSKIKETNYISRKMKKENSKIIVVDMRQYGEIISKNLMKYNFNVILLDDAWGEYSKAYADLIFNGTMVSKYHKYEKINKKSRILTGPKYWIMNEQFIKNQKTISEIGQKKKYNVVISMGGSNVGDLSSFIVKSILNLEKIFISVIIGPFFKKNNELVKLSQMTKKLKLVYSPSNIWNEFKKADIAISSAGNTLYELSVQRIPTISIAVVTHQVPYLEIFSSKNLCLNLGYKDKITPQKIKNSLIFLLENPNKRKQMFRSAVQIVDGKGFVRVTKIMDNYLKDKPKG